MGLLYANLMNYQSAARNLLLAALAVPIAFAANVLRVLILALVTYHLGDSAGQGFLHGLAGLTLFGVALAMLIGADWALGRLFLRGRGHE
jgi:exosortase/archaeosortase family protein